MPRETVVERSVEIPAPVREVFHFHLDTRNAPRISPPGARFLAIEGDFPVVQGSRVRLRVRQAPLPVAQEWLVRIDEVVPDRLVVDVAERSPFASWRHEHRFDPLGPELTLMTDRVAYRLPLGPLGAIAGGALVRRRIEDMFRVRHERTRELFAAARR